MKVISIANQKGGSTKTTTAVSLAVSADIAGKRVLVLDADPQASAGFWADVRESETPEVRSVHLSRLDKAIEKARGEGFDLVIVDTAPAAQGSELQAAQESDLTIVPTQIGLFDYGGASHTAEVLARFKHNYRILLSLVPHQGGPELKEIKEALEGEPVLPVMICNRRAVARAQKYGQTAQETEPESKAAQEAMALYDVVMSTISNEGM